MKDKRSLTAPCGLDCFNCEIHQDNLTQDFARMMSDKTGVPLVDIACRGCRQQDGTHWHLPPEGCATLTCAQGKGVELCCDCDEFPCPLLAPLAQGADRFPHNFKLYNLCRIKKYGIEKWIEEAGQIRKGYFSTPFVVGKGQSRESS
ncbi:MAG: DUF3795 domain-containing protein [bacterium]|nr:MAG: DUF3795 domain-containing protein [bacterium]